jgi:hypothetical protein
MLARRFVRPSRSRLGLGACALLLSTAPAQAQDAAASGAIEIGGRTYPSWSAYFQSDAFQRTGGRCGYRGEPGSAEARGGSPDCSATNTTPSASYEPDGADDYVITVVVHIIRNTAGTQGEISDQLVASQIDVLNEDFQAIKGSNGELGHRASIRFQLATEDPVGTPSTGITRHNNDTWFQDQGAYYNTIAWDPTRYLNIYTNLATGALGYVPFLPQSGPTGTAPDRVVIHWQAFGSPGPAPPYHLGRTVTHEVGHYLGLHHPFQGGCAPGTPPGCYTSGDLICDTFSLESPSGSGSCLVTQSCGSDDPVDNYMNYSDDVCMTRFTIEQVRRMRCTLENYRASLYDTVPVPTETKSWSSLKGMF